jgi:hypothetical protein
MLLRLYDISMPTGNPTSQLGTLTAQGTGGGSILIGSATTPFLPFPTIEPIYRVVADCNSQTFNSPAVPATQLLCMLFPPSAPLNSGGAQWGKPTAAQAFGRFTVGVVVAPPVPYAGPVTGPLAGTTNPGLFTNVPGGESLVCINGVCLASWTTVGAYTAGTMGISAIANNNLTNSAAATLGQGIGTALTNIAGATTGTFLTMVSGW